MPTPNERKALAFLAIVALSGSAVRLLRARSRDGVTGSDTQAIATQLARVDSARERRTKRSGRAVVPVASDSDTTKVDLDRATADAIESLPGVGPALAKRIVANRDSTGDFGGIDALCDVPGIGAALAERLRPLVTFTGAPRPLSDGCSTASKPGEKGHGARRRNKR